MSNKSKKFYIAQLLIAAVLLLSRVTASLGGPVGRYTDVLLLLVIGLSVYGLGRNVDFQRLPIAVRFLDVAVIALLGVYGFMVIFYAILFRNSTF